MLKQRTEQSTIDFGLGRVYSRRNSLQLSDQPFGLLFRARRETIACSQTTTWPVALCQLFGQKSAHQIEALQDRGQTSTLFAGPPLKAQLITRER